MLHTQWAMYLRILLYLHIAAGVVAFVCAPVALATAKGGLNHRKWGKIYFWAMAVVGVTALSLSLLLPVFFLAMVSVFSFYASFAGYRVLFLKDMNKGGRPKTYDWGAAIITFLSSALLFVMGFWKPHVMRIGLIEIAGHTISIVSVVFGILGMRLSSLSIQTFLHPPKEKMFWWFDHMQGMVASYIGAMTAFSAVNLSRWFGPAWWVWLWPTMIGVPAIIFWTRYYEKRFMPHPKSVAV